MNPSARSKPRLNPFYTVKHYTPEEHADGDISEQKQTAGEQSVWLRPDEPDLTSPDVDWEEFFKDFADRNFFETTIARLQKIIDGLNNAKTLHDFDSYQGALADYTFTQYKVQTAAPGLRRTNIVSCDSSLWGRLSPISPEDGNKWNIPKDETVSKVKSLFRFSNS